MRNDWTDDRLDAFSRETDRRFDEVDRKCGEVKESLSALNSRFDVLLEAVFSLHRMMFRASVGVILALVGILATQL